MAKKKNKTELEWLRSENRRLVKENKRLRQKHNLPIELAQDLEEESNIEILCEHCMRGEKIVTDLGPKKLITCSICDFRKVING